MTKAQYKLVDLATVLTMTDLTMSQLLGLIKADAFPDSWDNTDDNWFWLEVEVQQWLEAQKLSFPYIDVSLSSADTLVIQTKARPIKIALTDLMQLISNTKMPTGERFLQRVVFGPLKRMNCSAKQQLA